MKLASRLLIAVALLPFASLPFASLSLTSPAFAQNGQWLTITTANSGIVSNTVNEIVVDASQTLWLGTIKGLDRRTGTTWTSYYGDFTHIPSNDIFDFALSQGLVWVATRNGVTSTDGSTWTSYTSSNSGLVSGLPTCLNADNRGNVWVGTARGLSRIGSDLNWNTYTVTNTPTMPYNGIQALVSDSNATLYMTFISTAGIVTFPGGVSTAAKYIRQDTIPNFPKTYLTSLALDHAGALWGGTGLSGVIRITSAGATVFSTQTTSALKSNIINDVTVDQCGNVWIATNGGASMYNGSVWTTFTKAGGQLSHDSVTAVSIDGPGHIWFATLGGVTEFKPLPSAPTLLYPAMAAAVGDDSLTCHWTWACPGILKYWYEIADNPDFTNSTIDSVSTSLTQSASHFEGQLADHKTYYWKVKAMNDAGWGPFSNTWTFTVNKVGVALTEQHTPQAKLGQCFPNPCTDQGTISYEVPKREHVRLSMYDLLGREVLVLVNAEMGPGNFSATLDAAKLPHTGVYLYRLHAGSDISQQRMQVIR